ncbi:efflux RND transporter periplasmic adaptor subunit [Runella sp.]|uniref:efflux RND transporter periplasmic adaptor subunit n=1 Tax=Runella sp. TaxID=1960881 RepID=UPI0026284CF1|nr:efflux RND transporter periplasmic adaptor subunit [Runella sp.]
MSPCKGLNYNGKRSLFSFVARILRAVRFKSTVLPVRVVNANERGFCLAPFAFCFLLFAFCLFAFCLFLTGCNKTETAATEEATAAPAELKLTAEQEKNFGITLGSPEIRSVYDAVVLNGVVETPPQQSASISFPLTGIVRSVNVLSGSQVSKGSTLATIESLELIQLQEDYWKTVGQLTYAEQERQRQTTLSQEDVGAKRKLQQSESDFRVLEATKQGIEARLQVVGIDPNSLKINQIIRSIALRSPIAGVVKATRTNIGKSVTAGESLFEVVNQTGARLVLKVFEKDLNRIKIGQKVELENGTATITGLSNNFEAASRTVDVYAQLNGMRLLAGQYVNGKVVASPRQAETLPETAVVRTGETAHVFVKTPQGVYQPVAIKTGAAQNSFVEVIFTQKTTFPIVITGAQTLQAELTKGQGEEE